MQFATVDVDHWEAWSLLKVLQRMPVDNFEHYQNALIAHPIYVKACTSGAVYMIGDWVAQVCYCGRSSCSTVRLLSSERLILFSSWFSEMA